MTRRLLLNMREPNMFRRAMASFHFLQGNYNAEFYTVLQKDIAPDASRERQKKEEKWIIVIDNVEVNTVSHAHVKHTTNYRITAEWSRSVWDACLPKPVEFRLFWFSFRFLTLRAPTRFATRIARESSSHKPLLPIEEKRQRANLESQRSRTRCSSAAEGGIAGRYPVYKISRCRLFEHWAQCRDV